MAHFIPFPYFGGKSSKLNSIIHLFPKHKTYIEPYAGSLAVFFSKKPSKIEIVSDYNKRIFVFYKVLRDHTSDLERVCELTPYSETEMKFIEQEFKKPFDYEGKSKKELIEVARQVFAGYNMSFSGVNPGQGKGFSFSRNMNKTGSLKFKRDILGLLAKRIAKAIILSRKAEYVIKLFKEEKDAFFYLDPPYPETADNYETEYRKEDFNNLIEILKPIKGKFLLNCYKKDWMNFPKEWKVFEKDFLLTAAKNTGKPLKNIRKECFITNYEV